MAAPRTYQVDVEGVGLFVFRRRNMGDAARIPNEALKILGGIPEHGLLMDIAVKQATVAVLTVTAPADWKPEEMDPLDPDDVDRFEKVHGGLMKHEATFRRPSEAERPPVGPAT